MERPERRADREIDLPYGYYVNHYDRTTSWERPFAEPRAFHEETFARELKRQKALWMMAEDARREQWVMEKTKEINKIKDDAREDCAFLELKVRGHESEMHRLLCQQRDEMRRLEMQLRDEARREVASERARAEREMARLQEVGAAERQAAVKKEREAGERRLIDMSVHFIPGVNAQLHARLPSSLQTQMGGSLAARRLPEERTHRAVQGPELRGGGTFFAAVDAAAADAAAARSRTAYTSSAGDGGSSSADFFAAGGSVGLPTLGSFGPARATDAANSPSQVQPPPRLPPPPAYLSPLPPQDSSPRQPPREFPHEQGPPWNGPPGPGQRGGGGGSMPSGDTSWRACAADAAQVDWNSLYEQATLRSEPEAVEEQPAAIGPPASQNITSRSSPTSPTSATYIVIDDDSDEPAAMTTAAQASEAQANEAAAAELTAAHEATRKAEAEVEALREQLNQLRQQKARPPPPRGDDEADWWEHASDESFNSRYLALRQHIDFLREHASKVASTTWKLKVSRGRLVDDVLEAFAKLQNRGQLWRSTDVVFFDEFLQQEPGMDRGGLSSELHTKFWEGVVQPSAGLFESSPDSEGGNLLPRADASPERLRQLGRVLCKAVIDEHPIGGGLARFLFESLVFEHHAERRVFDEARPHAALRALRDYDATLAAQWGGWLDGGSEVEACGLALSDFDADLPDDAVTAANLPRAIVAGCRRRLLVGREGALRSLREGFTHFVDLTLQLAALSCDDMLRMVQGKLQISPEELVSCFIWPDASAQAAAKANFPAGSRVHEYLRTLLLDLDEESRFKFLQWATALRALPPGGLQMDDCITLNYINVDESYLPVAHTCTRVLDLPDYSSSEALKEKLEMALQHAGGFYEL